MATIQIELPEPHPGQKQVEDGAKRHNIFCCGRRWGKDVLLGRRIVKKALVCKQPVAWFAPTYRMLLDNWREIRNLLYPVTVRASDAEHRLDLITGQPLEMWSFENFDAARGHKYGHIAINEAGMVKNLEEALNNVIRPTLIDYKGGMDLGSTPRGLNYFFTLWSQAADNPDWARFHFTTYDNPHIPKDEIDTIVATLPERVVKQEILAEFIADGSFFQGIDAAAIVEQPDIPAQHPRHHLVMGCDWALFEDYTVLIVACRECNRVVDWQRFNQIDYAYQRERLVEMALRWKVAGVLPERNSIGVPNIELLMGRVPVLPGVDELPGFNTLPSTKPALIQGLAAALEHHGFKVPKAAADELRAYEVETLASGHPKFGAPEGQHDDWVMALALAWEALGGYAPLVGQPAQKSKWSAEPVADGESRWKRY